MRAEKNLQVIAGTPKTVIPKIKTILSVLRTGIFIILSIQGPVGRRRSHEPACACIAAGSDSRAQAACKGDRTCRIRFERTPGSVRLAAGTKRAPVVDRAALASLGL